MAGLETRGNILVLGATNRYSTLDSALVRPGRFGDDIIQIPRPNMKAAKAIFYKHLPVHIPYAANGHGAADDAQHHLVESVVSYLYATNGESELATLVYRDGRRHTVRSADVMSGAHISQVARLAIERACVREVETGEVGLRPEDVLSERQGRRSRGPFLQRRTQRVP